LALSTFGCPSDNVKRFHIEELVQKSSRYVCNNSEPRATEDSFYLETLASCFFQFYLQ